MNVVVAAAWATVGAFVLSMVTGAGAYVYAQRKNAKLEQKFVDDIGALMTWKARHESEYTVGLQQLSALKAGMSEGAEAGFARVEKQLERILDGVGENSKQVAEVTGQVKALTTNVGQLIAALPAMRGGHTA